MTNLVDDAEAVVSPYLIWVKLAGVLIVAAGLFGGGMWLEGTIKDKTIADMKTADAAAQVVAVNNAIKQQSAADKVSANLQMAAQRAHDEIEHTTFNLLLEVHQYVTPETDAHFPVPCGLVRVHDAALAGVDPATVPAPAGLQDGDPCPVKASDAASIIAWNYGKLREALSDLDTWDAWYVQQSAIWNATPKEK